MSETLLRFFLSELDVVRVICGTKDCGGVYEVPLARLEGDKNKPQCPLCYRPFTYLADREQKSPLHALASAIATLRAHEAIAQVQFVLPVKEQPS